MPAVVVLVEGESDAVVVRHLLARRGLDPRVVPMGGITNVRRYAEGLRATYPGVVVLALGDAGERRFLEKVEPPLDGVFVCERDLEEELFRALGREEVVDALAAIGDDERWVTFRAQPEWRGRPVDEQLHRFVGTRSGRKAALATELAGRLRHDRLPRPLASLLDAVAARGL